MTLETEVKSLQGLPMFRGVDPVRLKLLAFASERLRFEPGETVFHQGETSDAAFVILSGLVDVTLETPTGPIPLARVGKGAMIGEMGILCDRTRTATCSAAEPTDMLKIGRDLFYDMLREFPQMAIAVMRDLAKRLEHANEQIAARLAPA